MQARSRLYARRAKGDLDLGLEPARIDGAGNRRWSEIITPGGLLPGGTEQGILEWSANKNYRIGTRRVVEDRVFHYCYATTVGGKDAAHADIAITGNPKAQYGCFHNSNVHYHGNGAAQVLVPAGVTEFDFAYALAPTRRGNIPVAAHQLQDGIIASYGERACYRIADNDAYVSANGDLGTIHIYLKEAVWQAFGGGGVHTPYIYPNTYAQCVHPDIGISHDGLPYVPGVLQGWGAVVAVPLIEMTRPCYFWGQTWGPMPGLCGIWGNDIGDRPNAREVHFDWYGALVYRPGAEAADAHMQRAGTIITSQYFILQLAP